MARFSPAAAIVVGLSLQPRITFAEAAAPLDAPATNASSELARELFLHGVALSEQLRWAEAERAFARSAELAPTAACLLNLAVTRFQLNRPLPGLDALERLEALALPLGPEQAERARGIRQHLEQAVATVTIELKPPNAAVTLDGKELAEPAIGARLRLDPGRHVLLVRAEGYLDRSLLIELAPGEQRAVEVVLAPTPAAAARSEATALAGPRRPPSAALKRPAPPPPEHRSILSKPWFWVGAGALVVAGAVATSLALSSSPTPTAGSEGHVF